MGTTAQSDSGATYEDGASALNRRVWTDTSRRFDASTVLNPLEAIGHAFEEAKRCNYLVTCEKDRVPGSVWELRGMALRSVIQSLSSTPEELEHTLLDSIATLAAFDHALGLRQGAPIHAKALDRLNGRLRRFTRTTEYRYIWSQCRITQRFVEGDPAQDHTFQSGILLG